MESSNAAISAVPRRLLEQAQTEFMTMDPKIHHKSAQTADTVPLKTIMASKSLAFKQ